MYQTLIPLLLLQTLLGVMGASIAGWQGCALGLALAGVLYAAWIAFNGQRLLNWLKQGGTEATLPRVFGGFSVLMDYVRRVIRQKDSAVIVSQHRLDEFFAMLQASPNGVLLLDENDLIEWFNEIAARHFGFDPERDRFQLLANLLRDPTFNAYYTAQDYSRAITMEGRGSTVSRPVRISVQIYPYGQGKRLILSQDITAIEQADVMRRDFVANVSHEIRTPLTVLSGFIETLSSLDFSEDERRYYLNKMAKQATRMRQLVDDLLILSRLEGSPLPGYDEVFSLKPLIMSCLEEASALSTVLHKGEKAHHIQLANVADMDVCQIVGREAELRGAFSNLVNNAVRYTPAGGTITLQWQRLETGSFQFSVQDTGPGIDEAYLPRLAERFYRVDKGRSRDSGGTGLGLAIVKHVAQRHGGSLVIKSQLGKGSTFAIMIPATRVQYHSA